MISEEHLHLDGAATTRRSDSRSWHGEPKVINRSVKFGVRPELHLVRSPGDQSSPQSHAKRHHTDEPDSDDLELAAASDVRSGVRHGRIRYVASP